MTVDARRLTFLEIAGILFTFVLSAFMRSLYSLCGGQLLGILFGSVNQSPWELCKTLLLPWLLWSFIELMCLKPRLRRFAAAKTASLYSLAAVFLGLSLPAAATGINESVKFILTALVSVLAALIVFRLVYFSPRSPEKLFAESVFLLFLLMAFYFSFTPFPPDCVLFEDPLTKIKGIVPLYLDSGAFALSGAVYK